MVEGEGRAGRQSATGDGGHAAVSVTPGVDGTGSVGTRSTFASLKVCNLRVHV